MLKQPRRRGKRNKRGSGYSEHLPDGRFRVRLSFKRTDGTRHQPYAYGATPAEAQINAEALRRKWSNAPVPVGSIRDLVEAWIARHRETWAPNTVLLRETYTRRQIIPIVGDLLISRFCRLDFARFSHAMQQNGVSPSARYASLSALRSALRWAVAEGILPVDPVLLAKIEVPRPKMKEPYSIEEADTLLSEAARSHYYAIYLLALMGPLRQGECFALTFADLDFDKGIVHVRATLSDALDGGIIRKSPKTVESHRSLTMPKIVMDALAAIPRGRAEQYVFSDACGGPLRRSNFDRRHFHPLLQRAGLRRVVFHTLRHTSVSIMVSKGVPWTVIQQRGGWASIRTIQDIYAHSLRQDEAAAAAMFEKLFGQAHAD